MGCKKWQKTRYNESVWWCPYSTRYGMNESGGGQYKIRSDTIGAGCVVAAAIVVIIIIIVRTHNIPCPNSLMEIVYIAFRHTAGCDWLAFSGRRRRPTELLECAAAASTIILRLFTSPPNDSFPSRAAGLLCYYHSDRIDYRWIDKCQTRIHSPTIYGCQL